jgi:hypothetical protein
LALVLPILLYPEVVFFDEVLWAHDLRHHHHPWRAWAAAEWAVGRIPLWAPDVANGFPLMADGQTGVFYPVNILLGAVLPSRYALTASILVHTAWGAFGAWWLCRVLGRGAAASMTAAVAYTFSGFMIAHVTYAGMQAVGSWVPMAVGTTLLLARGGDWRWAAAWAACVASMLTAGHPQAAVIGLLGALWVFAWHARSLVAWIRAGLGAVLGVLAAGPQLLATLELTSHSAREGGVDAAFAGMGSLPPWELLNAVLPRFWGFERPADIALTYVHKGPLYFGTGENYWEDCFYLGVPLALLAMLGVLRKGAGCWKGLGLVSLFLMFGRYTPVYALFRLFPGMDLFRFPVRFSLLFTLAAVVLAARAVDELLNGRPDRLSRHFPRWVAWGLAAGVIGAGVGRLVLTWQDDRLRGILMGAFAQRGGAERVDALLAGMAWNTSPGSPGVWWPAALALSLCVILWAWHRRLLSRRAVGSGLLALVLVDGLSFARDFNPSEPSAFANADTLTAEIVTRESGLFRTTTVDRVHSPILDRDLLSSNLGLLAGTRDVIVLSPLLLPRHESLLAAVGMDVGMDHGVKKARDLEAHWPLVDMMGVRYLITVHPLESPRLEKLLTGEVNVYKNPLSRDRVFLVGCTEPAQDPQEALADLLILDPRTTAVVEGPGIACGPHPGNVDIDHYSPDEIRVSAVLDREGLLVLTDTWYPGWTVHVDDKPADIIRTNVTFRGVRLGPGAHEVVFHYEPAWAWSLPLAAGAWIGVLLGCLGAAASTGRRKWLKS